jgi:ferrochelatase
VSQLPYDAVLFVAFGGPEGRDDVMPFLENVLRGRNIPRERMLEVAEHYYHFGGVSPINGQVRDLIAAVREDFAANGVTLPIYWGNRNWTPYLADTLREMAGAGIKRALAFVVSAYSSYSGCRQYRENILDAQKAVGDEAPAVDKVRVFYNHPDFIAASVDCVRAAIERLPAESQAKPVIAFTAHSIPSSMASGCDYEKQLRETSRLVADALGIPADRWRLVYQSRSGRPEDPWLDPDICDFIKAIDPQETPGLVIAPIGFLSDHMEVLFDLDEQAAEAAQHRGIAMSRAATVGVHPKFVAMIRKLVLERLDSSAPKEAVGQFGPNWDVCAVDCCPAPRRPTRP